VGKWFDILRDAGKAWVAHRASVQAAALAYYTLFAIAPLLLIAIAVAGLVFGGAAARGDLIEQLRRVLGPDGAGALETMIAHARQGGGGMIALVLGGAALLIGAGGAFLQLQRALDVVWGVERRGGGLSAMITQRLLSFALALGAGLIFLASLVLSTALSAVQSQIGGGLPGSAVLWQVLDAAVSLLVLTAAFAMIFKFLPDVELGWGDVWVGAGITAVLFVVGQYLLGLYLSHTSTASAFGAAGAVVLLMVWIYYAAQILLYGAEITQLHALRRGSGLVPGENAVWVEGREF
jgi:membrane protein